MELPIWAYFLGTIIILIIVDKVNDIIEELWTK